MLTYCPKRFKAPRSKGLDGTGYKLDHSPFSFSYRTWKKTQPEQIIEATEKLDTKTRFYVSDLKRITPEEKKWLMDEEKNNFFDDDEPIFEITVDYGRRFKITDIQEKDGEVIIEADGRAYTSPKKKAILKKDKTIREIVPLIDFSNEKLRNRIKDMLVNVFTPEQLQKILNEDKIEILMFNKLMYLKLGDKAYRL